MVEGLAIGVLGGVALAWSMGYTRFGADGIPMLGLKVTPSHAGLLLIVGTLALLACLGRRAALVFSALTAFGWAALTIVCALRVAHHAPGVLGFDPRDSLLLWRTVRLQPGYVVLSGAGHVQRTHMNRATMRRCRSDREPSLTIRSVVGSQLATNV